MDAFARAGQSAGPYVFVFVVVAYLIYAFSVRRVQRVEEERKQARKDDIRAAKARARSASYIDREPDEPFEVGTVSAVDGSESEPSWMVVPWMTVAEWALTQSEHPDIREAWVRRTRVVAGTAETWTWQGGIQVSQVLEPLGSRHDA